MNRVITLSLVLLSASTLAAEKPIVAVFDVEAKGPQLSREVLERMSDYLASLLTSKGFQVVPRSSLLERLKEKKQETYKQCYDQQCQIEIGQELAAQKTLSAQIIALGGQCKLTLTLYDLKRAASEAGATESGACDEPALVAALEKAVVGLVGGGAPAVPPPTPPPAPPAVVPSLPADELLSPGGLVAWQRCALGQRWSGSGCEGMIDMLRREQVSGTCPTGFRVAAVKDYTELLGGCEIKLRKGQLGACRPCAQSETCRTLFPGDARDYWSWSAGAMGKNIPWVVHPASGAGRIFKPARKPLAKHSRIDETYPVRCVRDLSP